MKQTYEWYENGKIKAYESRDARGRLIRHVRYDEEGKALKHGEV